jgi:sucrose-6-phosphate hydrolase SacC (GH32 family)
VGGHDPEVFYFEPQNKYVMVIHDRRESKWGFDFYESDNLLSWKYLSSVPDMWETPNIYPLEYNGTTYWVLQQCDFGYYIGNFNGTVYTPLTELIKPFSGAYAMRTFDAKGRRIVMGSMGTEFKTDNGYKGYGCATLPMALSLADTDAGLRVLYKPVAELENFVISTETYTEFAEFECSLSDIEIKSRESFTIKSENECIAEYDAKNKTLKIAENLIKTESEKINLRLITDDSVLSYFADNGLSRGISRHNSFGKKITISGADEIKVRLLNSPYNERN